MKFLIFYLSCLDRGLSSEALFDKYGIRTMVLTNKEYKHKTFQDTNALEIIHIDKITDRQIENIVEKNYPNMIIFYGSRTFTVIGKIKKYIKINKLDIKVYCDVQGVPEEAVDFVKGIEKAKIYLNFLAHKLLLKHALGVADGAFVVSDGMINYCNVLAKRNKTNGFRYIKIRCGVEKIISSEKKCFGVKIHERS